MPNWIPIDDASNQIGYSGSWSVVKGSTRQWEAGVHSTTQNGASCVLRFKGVGIAFRATVPSGSGNQVFDYKIDSRASVRVSTAQKSSDEYGVELIRIENLPEAVHSISLTNAGGAPLQVDMFEYWPGTGDPNPAALFPADPEPTTRPTPTPTPTPRPPQQNTSSPPQQSTRPPNTPQPEPDPDPPTSAERTRTVASSETQMITSPTIGTSDNSEPRNGSSRSSSTSSSSQSVSTGGRTIETTDENGLVITKIIPTGTERMITSTDANGVVSTVTIVGAANTGSSVPLGAIIGIAIGSVIAILAVLIFILFCRRRRKRLRNAHYTAQPQETQQTRGLGIAHDGSAAAHSSTQLISPYAAHPSENPTVPSGPVWRKEGVTDEGYPSEHQRQPSSAATGAGFSTHAGSGLSYRGENVGASNDPPPAYRAPAQTLTEDSYSTASGMYGSEKQ